MQEVPVPRWGVADVMDTCNAFSKQVAKKFDGDREVLVDLEDRYRRAAREGFDCDFLDALSDVNSTSKNERLALYVNRMVGPRSSGHSYYRYAVRAGRELCAFCFARGATEVDHYIPKEEWSELCFMPINLLPVCSKCNKAKGESLSLDRREQFLHPYFESIDDFAWVSASVENERPIPEFRIVTLGKDAVFGQRVKWQSERLSLPKTYKEFAGRRLRDLRIAIYSDHGDEPDPQRVKAYIGRLAKNAYAGHTRNYWEAQCLKAWWRSEWFLEEGCRLPKRQRAELQKKLQKDDFLAEDGASGLEEASVG